ncbi:hypothetical protein A0H81_02814 [Grifola frondosa]|uniref:Uncharacterized protein n=1 Tax=Grifola frondosa TaxID=5627 RepID=A0A1C7MN41_GRIFR|nr:hypothetical protein A0H81_10984 [Grifola frondosa]OBZ77816.1 hypothetical protein A0H81_02814 [Grifola frondosa]
MHKVNIKQLNSSLASGVSRSMQILANSSSITTSKLSTSLQKEPANSKYKSTRHLLALKAESLELLKKVNYMAVLDHLEATGTDACTSEMAFKATVFTIANDAADESEDESEIPGVMNEENAGNLVDFIDNLGIHMIQNDTGEMVSTPSESVKHVDT